LTLPYFDFFTLSFTFLQFYQLQVSKLSLQIGSVFQSAQCPSFHTCTHGRLGGKKNNVFQPERAPKYPKCDETGADFKVGGPLWLGPLHDPEVIQTALDRLTKKDDNSYPNMKWIDTQERLEGLLLSCKEELNDVPLYYAMTDFSKVLKISAPPINDVKAALMNAGYRVSGYHKDPQAIKTDAPNKFLWDIMRTFYKKNPPKKQPDADSAAAKILAVEATSEIDFSHPKELREQIARTIGKGGKKKISRFPMNPEANWGPKKAASGHKRKNDER
jgi:tRNA (guanine26-N2/guanine27-N2)-dimethyltransferase